MLRIVCVPWATTTMSSILALCFAGEDTAGEKEKNQHLNEAFYCGTQTCIQTMLTSIFFLFVCGALKVSLPQTPKHPQLQLHEYRMQKTYLSSSISLTNGWCKHFI